MASSIRKHYQRTQYVLAKEGLFTLLKHGFLFIGNWLFQNKSYLIYKRDFTAFHPETETKLKPEFVLKVIYNSVDYSQLTIEGYNFKDKVNQSSFTKGAMVFCIFNKLELVYIHWIATTESAKQEFDIVPFKVDYKKGEVCSGGSYTDPRYRNLGLHSYVLSIKPNILAQKGVKTNKCSIRKGNIASLKTNLKFDTKLISQWHYLKILWWKSWKETIFEGEDIRGQKRYTLMDRLFAMGTKVYLITPPAINFIFKPISVFKNIHLRVDQWILTGEEISRKHRVDILYSGSLENKNYLADLVFGSSHEEKYQGKKWLWNCLGSSNRKLNCNLYFTDSPKIFKSLYLNRGSFVIPSWIKGEAEIPDDLSSLVNNDWSLRRNQKKIQKNQYHYEVTRDLLQYYHFYYDMYLPYIKAAYGDKAIVMSYEDLKVKFNNYELLIVKQQGKDIAGALLFCTAHEASFSLAGVLDGNLEYVKSGALAALYYFFLCYLQTKGYKNVNLGTTRAFLKDGVLQYKKKWGLKLTQASETVFTMNILSLTDGVRDFLLNNPFICLDRAGTNGAFFIASEEPISENDLDNISKTYVVKGMRKIFIYRLGKNDIKLLKKVALPVSDGCETVRTEGQRLLS